MVHRIIACAWSCIKEAMIFGKSYYKSPRGCVIKPGRIIYEHTPYKITNLHENYHIKKYYIIVNNKKENLFRDLIISQCFHPNAMGSEDVGVVKIEEPPKYSRFCLPDNIFGSKFINSDEHRLILRGDIKPPDHRIISDMYIRMAFLRIWAMDNPHHVPNNKSVETEPRLPFH